MNYETNEYKLLQLVIFAQTELLPKIKDLKNFYDRISLKYILNPFDVQEVKEMVDFRLKKAGFSSEKGLFDEGAIEEIYKNTQGYPRRVSMLCHKMLIELVLNNKDVVTKEMVQRAVTKEVLV